MCNLRETDKFLEMCNFPRLNQEEIENMKRPITSNKTEPVKIIIKTPNKQKSRTRWLHGWILPNIQRRGNTYPFQTSPKKMQRKECFSTHFKASIILTTKIDKDITKKKITGQYHFIDVKILNKILANQIQQHI